MSENIKKVDENHIVIVETNISETLVAKVTLEAKKLALLEEIAKIDAMLPLFVPPSN